MRIVARRVSIVWVVWKQTPLLHWGDFPQWRRSLNWGCHKESLSYSYWRKNKQGNEWKNWVFKLIRIINEDENFSLSQKDKWIGIDELYWCYPNGNVRSNGTFFRSRADLKWRKSDPIASISVNTVFAYRHSILCKTHNCQIRESVAHTN